MEFNNGRRIRHITMHWIGAVFLTLIVSGCATEEHGRLVNPGEVTWIQKGVTTRSDVVERLGVPRFETPLPLTTTSTTTTTATVEGKSAKMTTTVEVDEPPTRTRATYLHTESDSSIPFAPKVHTTQFWVVYDAMDVVQEYGFQEYGFGGDTPLTASRE